MLLPSRLLEPPVVANSGVQPPNTKQTH